MRAILDHYQPFMPPEAVAALRKYSTLDKAGRKAALSLAGVIVKDPPTPASSALYAVRDAEPLTDVYGGESPPGSLPRLPRPHTTMLTRPTPPIPGIAASPITAKPAPKRAAPAVKQMSPDDPVMYLPRVGPKNATLFEKLGVRTLRDLLYLVPRRHDDYSALASLGSLGPGDVVTVLGEVRRIAEVTSSSGKPRTIATIADDTGAIGITWFSPYIARQVQTAGPAHS